MIIKVGKASLFKEKNKNTRTSMDRIMESIKINDSSKGDKIEFVDGNIILELYGVKLISNNDLLRTHNRDVSKYKKSWQRRIGNIVKNLDSWDPKGEYKIEFLYSRKSKIKMDFDGIIGSFKYVLDSLVKSGVFEDDSVKYVPYILPTQKKGDEFLKILISPNDIGMSRVFKEKIEGDDNS